MAATRPAVVSCCPEIDHAIADTKELVGFEQRFQQVLEENIANYEKSPDAVFSEEKGNAMRTQMLDSLKRSFVIAERLKALGATKQNSLRCKEDKVSLKEYYATQLSDLDEVASNVSKQQRYIAFEKRVKKLIGRTAKCAAAVAANDEDCRAVNSAAAVGTDDADTEELPPELRDEEDIACSAGTQRLIDPMTRQEIRHPVRNRFCKHVYDRQSITEYIGHSHKRLCPYVGCREKRPLNLKYLDDDEELMIQLATQHSRME